jgi:hypothetical protein
MATTPFPGIWSSYSEFDGNSQFVLDTEDNIWLVSTTTSIGISLYLSTNNGFSFSQVVQLIAPSSSTLEFDPAIELDSLGNLRIIGQVAAGSQISVVAFLYNIGTATLTGPTTVNTGATTPSDYDVIDFGAGTAFVVSLLTVNSVETVMCYVLDASNNLTTTSLLESVPQGTRYTAVSLSPLTFEGNTSIAIFFIVMNNFVTAQPVGLRVIGGLYSDGQFEATFESQPLSVKYAERDLTILYDGVSSLYAVLGYYTQVQSVLAGSIALVSFDLSSGNVQPMPVSILGTPTASLIKPVLSISASGLVLAYITSNMSLGTMLDGPISLFDVNPDAWILTPRTDFPYVTVAYYLRGTQSLLPANAPWVLLAQQVEGTARVFSGFNSPPVVVLSPTSLTAVRGVTYEIDASGSFDANLDTLEYVWSITDPSGLAIFVTDSDTADLTIPLVVGPAAFTLTVSVAVTAYSPSGVALYAPISASLTVTVPAVALPVIDPLPIIQAARNSLVTIAPTITDAAGSALGYAWVQTSGTPVTLVSALNRASLQLLTNGVLIAGETLIFTLTVSDGINIAVSQSFQVTVAGRALDPKRTSLARILRTELPISSRNTNSTWGTPRQQGLVTAFTSARQGSLVSGYQTSTFIGPSEILAITGPYSYHVYLPNTADTILDAVHDSIDVVLVLAASSNIFVYVPTTLDTDDVFATINIADFSLSRYETLFATPQFANQRVLALSGPAGCLLLLIECTGYTVTSTLELTLASGLLDGADNVQWVRLSNVESLHSGQVLIGTVDGSNNSYETLISLQTRTVTAVWDSTSLQSDVVTTGEILTTTPDTYSGAPLAPVITSVVGNSNNTITLTWTQNRSDLVTAYVLQVATDATHFTFLMRVNSGQVLNATTPALVPGNTYTFEVQAQSLDGASPFSNPSSVTV